MFETSLDGLVEAGDLLVIVDPEDDAQILVFGDPQRAAGLGEVVGAIPGQLAAVAVGADALVKAGIAVGEQSGLLVRLTAESSRAVANLNKTSDRTGAVMGVLRDQRGTFRHVVRFRPARGVAALSSLTNVFGAVSMQAQLASIEKTLRALAENVRQVQSTLDNRAEADRRALAMQLEEIYRAARATGLLTQSAWDQIAGSGRDAIRDVEFAQLELDSLMDGIKTRTSVAKRREWIDKNEGLLRARLAALDRANCTLVQYQALRIWWLSITEDPSLDHYLAELRENVASLHRLPTAVRSDIADALDQAGKTWWFDRVHSPFHTQAVVERYGRVSSDLRGAPAPSELGAIEPSTNVPGDSGELEPGENQKRDGPN